MSEQRDDATNDKIDLRSKMKEIIKIQRERKGKLSDNFTLIAIRTATLFFLKVSEVAYERLVTRQFKVEKNFDKFCRETKSALKYFTDQIEDQSD